MVRSATSISLIVVETYKLIIFINLVNIDPDNPVPFAQNTKVIVEEPKTDHDNWSNTVNVPVPLGILVFIQHLTILPVICVENLCSIFQCYNVNV